MKFMITYVGKDDRYFENLKKDMTELYNAYTVAFRHYRLNDESKYPQVFDQIMSEKPNILYLDFSTDVEEITKLLNLCVAYQQKDIALIAFYPQLDNDKSREKIMGINLELGIDANIVKSGTDFIEPIYLGMRLALPQYLIKPSFYEIKEKDGIKGKLIDIGKVNYISESEIECETNLELMIEDEVEVDHKLPADIVESQIFTCLDNDNKNLYYKRFFKSKLQPIFIDHIFEKEDLTKLERLKVEDDKERREEIIETKNKPKYKEWIDEQKGESLPKLVRVGLIDHNLCLLKDLDSIQSETVFSYRVWADAKKCENELILYQPDIILFQLENDPTSGSLNNDTALARLIKFITINEYEPYIVLFGSNETAESMQDKLGYAKIITNRENIYMDAVNGLVKSFETKS